MAKERKRKYFPAVRGVMSKVRCVATRRAPRGDLVPPKALEPIRRQRSVARRILDIAMAKAGLQRPGVVAVICQLVAAGTPAAARVQACVALLDRGWGKPKQTVGGDPENPLAMTISEIRHTIVDHRRSDDQDENSIRLRRAGSLSE
jgi:hypothetical protein